MHIRDPRRRAARVGALVQEEISELLLRQTKDPRLKGMVSVTEVFVSPDLKFARVYVSVLGSEAEQQQTIERLTAASGFFRRELSTRVTLRHIPELRFYPDESIARGDRVLRLLREVAPEQKQ